MSYPDVGIAQQYTEWDEPEDTEQWICLGCDAMFKAPRNLASACYALQHAGWRIENEYQGWATCPACLEKEEGASD